jgi:CheY-like chemotaxis protein
MIRNQPAVLVVEDEAFIRMAAADMLEDEGIFPLEAGDGTEALRMIEEDPGIDLLFTDVNMPGGIDGVTLARRARRIRPGLAVIVTSGKRRVPEEELPGGGTFLPKPYRAEQLIEAVAQELDRSEA